MAAARRQVAIGLKIFNISHIDDRTERFNSRFYLYCRWWDPYYHRPRHLSFCTHPESVTTKAE